MDGNKYNEIDGKEDPEQPQKFNNSPLPARAND
jgi:hypothetical protein